MVFQAGLQETIFTILCKIERRTSSFAFNAFPPRGCFIRHTTPAHLHLTPSALHRLHPGAPPMLASAAFYARGRLGEATCVCRALRILAWREADARGGADFGMTIGRPPEEPTDDHAARGHDDRDWASGWRAPIIRRPRASGWAETPEGNLGRPHLSLSPEGEREGGRGGGEEEGREREFFFFEGYAPSGNRTRVA